MEKHVPRLQGVFREFGLVRYQRNTVTEVTIVGDTQQVRQLPRWDFGDKDRRWLISIAQDFVTVFTSGYAGFGGFASRVEQILSGFASISSPAILDRVGLRYVDIVNPPPADAIEDWLHPSLCGFPILGGQSPRAVLTQTVAKTDEGRLVVKSMSLPPKQPLPPDLTPTDLALESRLSEGPGRIAIDFDHIAEPSSDFSVATSMDAIRRLHAGLREPFRMAATEKARASWGPEVPE